MEKVEPKVYKEGLLFKRQRGLHKASTSKLKFQERFIRLTSTSLDYYDPNPKKRGDGPKGQFAVEQLRIVEILPPYTFGKDYMYLFQIGDNVEIMYFAAKSSKERDEWLEACRAAAFEWGNKMLSHFHKGVFGLINKGRWSCCANPTRSCSGCSQTSLCRDSMLFDIKTCIGGTRSLPMEAKDLTFTTTLPTHITTNSTPPSSAGSSPPPTPSDETTPYSSSFSDKIFMTADPAPVYPAIRSFTLAGPVLQRPDPKRVKELRDSKRLTQDLEEAELATKHEGHIDATHERNIVVTQEVNHRSGASSPSLSIDSGKGASSEAGSRPNSQVINYSIDESNVRTVRSETDMRKKSNQSVHSDQGVVTDETTSPKALPRSQTVVEEPDGPKQPASLPAVHFTPHLRNDGPQQPNSLPALHFTPHLNTEVRKDKGSCEEEKEIESLKIEVKEKCADTIVNEKTDKEKHVEEVKWRKMSSPERTPTPEHSKLRQRPISEMSTSGSADSLKGMSGNRNSVFGSGSDVSTPGTPQHLKRISAISGTSSSPRLGDRPRSQLISTLPIIMDQEYSLYGWHYSRLHQACEDGNLEMLEERLDEGRVDLNEPSYTPVPYTPLFIAFMSDHYQTMVCLLEHGADPNIPEPQNKASVLHWACERGCLETVELLIKYNADVNMKDYYGNTPLMEACKQGHLDIVKILLQSGAEVNHEGQNRRTPLHEASDAGHPTITELLIKQGANPIPRDDNDSTPYDLAFNKGHTKVMKVLQQLIPESVCPYSLLLSHRFPSSQMITTLAFKGNDVLISGCRDCHACLWDTSDLSVLRCVRVSNTVLQVDIKGGSLVIGSTLIQLVDTENLEKRRTIADDTVSDESLENPPLHLVTFGPKGHLVTATVESNIVKIWPPLSQSNIVTTPDFSITVKHEQGQEEAGCVYSISVSPNPNSPWLAVSLQPGKIFQPKGNKLVCLYKWDSRELHHIFDAGDGGLGVSVHTMFSPDGNHLAIACAENLCIWEADSGNLLYKFTLPEDISITSVSYSPDATHLAAGLTTGEVKVFEISSSSVIFTLSKPKTPSPVTSLAYSEDGKLFAVGHQNGVLQLFEGRQGCVSPL